MVNEEHDREQDATSAVDTAADPICEALGRHSEKLAALYTVATATSVTSERLVLTFRFPVHARLVAQHAQEVLDAVREVTGIRVSNLVTEVEPAASTPPSPQKER